MGTSAGAIVAAHLVAGRSPRRPSAVGTELEVRNSQPVRGLAVAAAAAARRAGSLALAASSTFAPLALGVAAPGGALVRSLLLRGLPRPPDTLARLRSHVEQSGARFDGRLRVAAVDRGSGRRVVFGSPGAPRATVAEAVEASCTVPWLFAPVRIGDREYVDGGVWSPTNLDAAPAGRDTHVLCLNPTANLSTTHTLLAVMRNVARSAVSIESLAAAAPGRRRQDDRPQRRVRGGDGLELHGPGAAHPRTGGGIPAGTSGRRRRAPLVVARPRQADVALDGRSFRWSVGVGQRAPGGDSWRLDGWLSVRGSNVWRPRLGPGERWREMSRRVLIIAACVCALAAGIAPSVSLAANRPAGHAAVAPGGPGAESYFDLARKDCVGTARNTNSKVWFTVADGVLSDVYWPTVDATNVKTLQYVVTDGRSFTDLQTRDMTYSVATRPDRDVVHGGRIGRRPQLPDHHHLCGRPVPRRRAHAHPLRTVRPADSAVRAARSSGRRDRGRRAPRTRAQTPPTLASVDGRPVPVASNPNTSTNAVNRSYAVPTFEALESSGGFSSASVGYAGTASDGLTMLDSARSSRPTPRRRTGTSH